MIDKLNKAIQLAIENPNLEVKVMVDSEIAPNTDYPYWLGTIKEVAITIYWEGEDDMLIGEENIKDRLEDWLRNDVDMDIDEENIKEEINHQYLEMLASGEVRQAIIMFITF